MVVIAVSVLAVVAVVGRNAQRAVVLAVTTVVPAGSPVTAEHLTTVELPVDSPIPAIPADQLDEVVGRTAAVTLAAGTVLVPGHLSAEPRVRPAEALVGAVLSPGQYPVDLAPGDLVRLVETPAAGHLDGQQAIVDRGSAEVRAVAEPATGSAALVVSLLVPGEIAPVVAAAGAQGRLSLVVVGNR
jgi:hypothetical protein